MAHWSELVRVGQRTYHLTQLPRVSGSTMRGAQLVNMIITHITTGFHDNPSKVVGLSQLVSP